MNNKIFTILVIILSVIGIGLGYAIFQMKSSPSLQITETGNSPSGTDTSVPASSPGSPEQLPPFPPENASQSEFNTFNDAIRAMGKQTNTLDITGCNPEPLVLILQSKSELTIVNNDPAEHKLVHAKLNITVPAKSKKTVPVDFDVGAYGYSCDDTGPVGIIQID